MTVQCFSVEQMVDMLGEICDTRYENGTAVHRAAVCHFLCVKLGDSDTTTHGKFQQALGEDAMSRAQAFLWQNPR